MTLKPRFGLYPYQRQVLADTHHLLSLPERRVVAHLPTGAGKTRIAAHAACDLLNANDADNAIVIWLAAAEELCDQAADQLSSAWQSLGRREVEMHRHWGNESVDLRRLAAGFLVCGLAKLRAAAVKDNTLLAHLADRAAAVIFDEAHQAIAETYEFVTEQLCTVRPPLLGLTATPGRTTAVSDADRQLAEMFCRNKVSIDPRGYDSPITYLIHNQYLADPQFVPVDFESDTAVEEPEHGLDYSATALDAIGRDHRRVRAIAELTQDAVNRHPRTIVFCPSVKCAIECNELLRSRGIMSDVVTADTTEDRREAIINQFRGDDRTPMVLLNFGVFTAGFDAPRTRCVIIARPTTSLVLYSQMAGRAMRGPRAGGNSRAEIFTVADTDLPCFRSLTRAFSNWEELWSTS